MWISCTLVQMYSELETYTEKLVPILWQSGCFVCIHSLSSAQNAIGEGWRKCERTGYVSFYNKYAHLFLLLINTVHGLTPLVIVDFPFECYTQPSEVRFGAGHSLWVYFLDIPDSMLLLLGVLLYTDGGGNLTAVALLIVHGLCCCILPVLPVAGISLCSW